MMDVPDSHAYRFLDNNFSLDKRFPVKRNGK